jgi:hypothetical protein
MDVGEDTWPMNMFLSHWFNREMRRGTRESVQEVFLKKVEKCHSGKGLLFVLSCFVFEMVWLYSPGWP